MQVVDRFFVDKSSQMEVIDTKREEGIQVICSISVFQYRAIFIGLKVEITIDNG